VRLVFEDAAWEDYVYWINNDRRVLKKVNELISDIRRTPYAGLGKPEPLRFELSGWWSRRIDREHRLVYRVDGDAILIAQCRFHY
jgi:toxin YoeB